MNWFSTDGAIKLDWIDGGLYRVLFVIESRSGYIYFIFIFLHSKGGGFYGKKEEISEVAKPTDLVVSVI